MDKVFNVYRHRAGRNGFYLPGILGGDEAEAAFNAWLKLGGKGRPIVSQEGSKVFVNNIKFSVSEA